MNWQELDEFVATMTHWTEVQQHLEDIGAQRSASARLVDFRQPHLAGDRLLLPNGPGREQSSDGEIDLSVTLDDDGCYTLRKTGYERNDTFTDQPEWRASTFELVGKYVLVKKNSAFRWKIGAPNAYHRWLDRGLAPQWTKEHLTREESGVDWMYKFTDTSADNTFYFDYENGDPLTFPFSMSYADITTVYMEGVPQPR
ncbi:hypothetical protein AXK57_21425 [Tsukamurella pulmonis]|uniref:hypothetical protein n=1 Tax=Tsukamurella pulmonis TaxID=47312 RepID=UPI000797FFAE|nr:hypothetical protein [Tsukamurella pulmonis]KXP11810.1 hypothetical protein AXK57_21425 [Tsukamurella pulmonis]RDH13319.1 hypothetical protein DVB88_03040 [Tsukamurella pulmonis]